jgi:hypothetical protein
VAAGKQTLAEVSQEIAVTDFQLLPEIFCRLLLLLKVSIDLIPVGEIIGDCAIDLNQGERGKVLADFLRGGSFPKGMDHAVQRNAGVSNPPSSLRGAGEKVWKGNL